MASVKPTTRVNEALTKDNQTINAVIEVKSYPNPTTDLFNIEWISDIKVSVVRLTTIEGKVVLIKKIDNTVTYTSFSTQELSSGLYLIEFVADKNIDPQKITVIK